MKKFNSYIIAAGAILIAAVSCNKADNAVSETAAPAVKVNIYVDELEPGTKAVKTGWTTGDIINVYLDDIIAHTPDFTLTYNGSKWVASEITSEVTGRLKASGYLKGFWEGSNSYASSAEWNKWMAGTNYAYIDFPDLAKKSTTGVQTQLLACFKNDYTFDGSELTASISTWDKTGTTFQMVVTGLPSGSYSLYTDSNQIGAVQGICVAGNNVSSSNYGSTSSSFKIAGIQNADGVAFVGQVLRTNINMSYNFYLVDNSTSKTYKFTKTVTLYTDGGKTAAVKLPFDTDHFTEI